MVLLLLAFAVVALSATAVVAALQLERPTASLVAWLLVVLAQVNVAVLVAGAALENLTPTVLLAVTVVIALVTGGIAAAGHGVAPLAELADRLWDQGASRISRPSRGTRVIDDEADDSTDGIASSTAAGPTVEGPVVAGDERGAWHRAARSWLGGAAAHPVHLGCGVAIVVLYGWHLVLAVALPIVDYDGLALHATAVAHWVTSGGFGPSGLSATVDSAPLGPAAISAWAATFTGSLRWVFVTQMAFALLGAVAVADLARQFGAKAADAVLAGILFAGVPVVALHATSAYADLGASSTLLAAWALGLGALRRASGETDRSALGGHGRPGELALIGVALGLAAAARPANLAAVAVFTVLVVVGTAVAARRCGLETGSTLATAARNVGLVLVPVVVLAGYWYVRNWARFANPLHPFTFGPFTGDGTPEALLVAPNRPASLDGLGAFAQIVASWVGDLSPSTYSVDQRLGGLGPVFLLALLPGLVVFVHRSWRSDRDAVVAVVLPAVALVIAQPAPWWSRGTLFFAGVAAAAFAAVVPTDRGSARNLVLGAATVLLGWGLWATAATTVYSDADSFQRLGLGEAWSLLGDGDRAHAVQPYGNFAVLDQYPTGTTVALLEGQIPSQRAPLYGRDLRRRVVVLPATTDPGELVASMSAVGADVAVVSVTSQPLIDEIRAPASPLRIVGEQGSSPARTVLVEPA